MKSYFKWLNDVVSQAKSSCIAPASFNLSMNANKESLTLTNIGVITAYTAGLFDTVNRQNTKK